ncbi:MAG TPA: hypothetical protein VGX91_10140 [Candidatus Cybelea sp.]|nr:hypothetical protein [Candidatus Cybelea sp.]
MIGFLASSASGYLALFSVFATVALAYVLRQRRATLRPHELFGYAILFVVLAHAMLAMTSGISLRGGSAGLAPASVALLLVVLQVSLGQSLTAARAGRATLRRFHFATMAAIVGLSLLHAYLNGALLRALL